MDITKKHINIEKTQLNTYQYLAILLKKLSNDEILSGLNCNFNVSFQFDKINEYDLNKKYIFNDEINDILTTYFVKIKRKKFTNLVYYNNISDNNIIASDKYIQKFKNVLPMLKDNNKSYCDFKIETSLEIEEEKDNCSYYKIIDSYFKQKINNIGKSIIFYKQYKESYIPFLLAFNNFINQKSLKDINLITLSKFNQLFELFDQEDEFNFPESLINIKFIDTILKYKNILDKKSDTSSASCSTSIFKITFESKGNIILSLNSIVVCREEYLGRFKYIPHPGILLFIKSLQLMDKYELLFTKIQKHIIKTF